MSEESGKALGLQPLDEGLPQEVKTFATELRVLFLDLGVSLRQHGIKYHYNNSSVSRFLSGQRMPQWTFVEELMQEKAARGSAVRTEVRIHLRTLYDAALQAAKPHDKAHRLRDELAVVRADLDSARVHEKVLEQAMHARQQQIDELQGRLSLEQALRSQEQITHSSELAIRETEINALRDQLAGLRQDLERVNARISDLEQHASEVEIALDAAEDEEEAEAPALVPAEQRLRALRVDLHHIEKLTKTAGWGGPLGVTGQKVDDIREKKPEARTSDTDLDHLVDLLATDLAQQVQASQEPGSLFQRFIGERPHGAYSAEYKASVLCLTLSAVHRSRDRQAEQEQWREQAASHFRSAYPQFLGSPSSTGRKFISGAGYVSKTTDQDREDHSVYRQRVMAAFEACQDRLNPDLQE
ncbi:hypothetical protein [Streptomyces sp. NPDC020817]|uniref:hypothetical protein n=1 Tax=Streptomyces sp. NPDC020817 TaxID=3365095 RepID=UPI0037B3361B